MLPGLVWWKCDRQQQLNTGRATSSIDDEFTPFEPRLVTDLVVA
ncbi:MAG: hypothetical protein P2A85_18920 [Microcoleus anatoxicus]